TFRIRRADDGAERWVTMNGWRTFKTDSQLRRIIMTVRDVTAEKTAEERVRWSASHDPLTRLANRSLFQDSLDQAIQAAITGGGTVGLLLLDLDHFKQINDTLGHQTGDNVLREFSAALDRSVRETDLAARYGGEEFVVVLPETTVEGAAQLAERICAAVRREPFRHDGEEPLHVTVSVGGAAFPEHGSSPATLMRAADKALYVAKGGGRDRWHVPGAPQD
ncbi:MAG TPA: sensor domain-containing diguanylate cyclase, partial [Actinomycetes bacterium]